MTPRPLAQLAAELESLSGSGDPEVSHSRGDDLLIEAIDRLAPYATETTDEGEADRVISAFRALTRWYA